MSASLIPQNLQRRTRRELFSIWPAVFPQWGFPGSSVVKNPCASVGDVIQSLDWDDPLEKERATRSSILAWKIPWTEEPAGLQSVELQKSQT